MVRHRKNVDGDKMETLAATASIAGILSLVGQSIEGLKKLKDFYSLLSSASRTVYRFLHDINTLLKTLQNIENLLSMWPPEKKDVNITSLSIQLEECSKNIGIWLETASRMRLATDKGGKAWFKRFWVAVNDDAVKDIKLEIDRHRHALNISLAVIGR